MGKISVWIVICVLIVLFFTINSFQNCSAVGPSGCQCGLRNLPGQEVGEADVLRDSEGKTTMKMMAFCNFKMYDNYSELHFNISAISEQRWIIELDPYEFILTPSHDSQLIDINITVPKNTSFYIMDTITINGKAIVNNGEITLLFGPQTATIRVKQNFGIEINKDALSKTIKKGHNKVLNFTIMNTGNARDHFELEVNNQTALAKAGITLSYPTKIEIEPWEKQLVKVLINTTQETKIGKYNFDLLIKSNQEERNIGFSKSNRTVHISIEVIKEEKNRSPISLIVLIRLLIVILIIGLILISFYTAKRSKKN